MALRIFVLTDNHVGCHENSAVRHRDASKTFEEAFQLAEAANVDFVLQCGDLFDKNKPSKPAMYDVIRTLRTHCLNNRAVEFAVLNDVEFMPPDAANFNYPNFEDTNLNVGLPVFAISGNHDDSGGGYGVPISPLDILGVSGLLNHFGRVHNNAQIDVVPILIQKDRVKVALYGIANVRDERLYQTFREGQVRFQRPAEDPDSWYSILVLHQNHTYRGTKQLNPEDLVPPFIDLVVWGHEHECKIEPQLNQQHKFYVMQPGSTVATSYHRSETGPKHVAVISIDERRELVVEKFPLRTVRPFVFRSIVLSEEASHIPPRAPDSRKHIMAWLAEQVEAMIAEANEQWAESHSESEPPMLPLIRIRVDYSYGYELENAARFGNQFAERIANPEELLHAVRRRETEKKWLPYAPSTTSEALIDENTAGISVAQVAALMKEALAQEDLAVLTEKDMSEAIVKFVEKEDSSALNTEVGELAQRQIAKLRIEPEHSAGAEEDDTGDITRDVVNESDEEPSSRSFTSTAGPSKPTPASTRASATSSRLSTASSRASTRASNTRTSSPKPAPARVSSTRASRASTKEPPPVEETQPGPVIEKTSTRRARSTRASPPPEDSPDEAMDLGDDSSDMFSDG